MITVKCPGNFNSTLTYFDRIKEALGFGFLDKYGEQGVQALKAMTPKDSGTTADSWYYEIEHSAGKTAIYWCNSNTNDGVNIAVILQYGHATGTGGYVYGCDYINPAIKDTFKRIADEAWREVAYI